MTQEQTKQLLCTQHRNLLYIILHFGNGAMLLPQLRTFCLALGLYSNWQAVNRAVRELREAAILAQASPKNYGAQVEQLKAGTEQRSRLARGEPINSMPADSVPAITLEKPHRRGLYIIGVFPKKQTICFALFAGRETTAQKVMDWVADTHLWVASLLPSYRTVLYVYALDANHAGAVKSALTAVAPGTEQTPYYRYRLEGQKMAGRVQLGVTDSHFIENWCGGVCRTNQSH